VIVASILLFLHTKQNNFQEIVREELSHKSHQQGVRTCGGLVFGFLFLVIINCLIKNYKLSVSLLVFYCFLNYFVKRLSLKSLFIISQIMLFIFTFINFSKIKLIFLSETVTLTITLLLILLLGFFDDVRKIKLGKGLNPNILFITQGLIGTIPVMFNYLSDKKYLQILSYKLDLKYFYIPFGLFIFNATINGANLTDGLNGGLAIPSLFIFIFFIAHSIKVVFINSLFFIPIYNNNYVLFSTTIIGCLIPFIFFNMKNKLFMGNIGSMFIGCLIVTICMLMKSETLLPFFCILFVIEVLSVIIQRFWFRRFKKRLFLFTPIHHHFELLHWSNKKIVSLMSFVTILGCLAAFYML
jgi:phospho-N-acetylmuramoyl-pentapeptide-transferase